MLSTLEEIGDGPDRDKAVVATGLYLQVRSFKFLISLIIFDRVLSCTKSLSDQLQSPQVDLASASDLVLATKETLEEFRDDKAWSHLYGYVQSVAELYNIEQHAPRQLRKKKLLLVLQILSSSSLQDREVVFQPVTNTKFLCIFRSCMDAFLAELRRRFDEKNIEIMRSIQACHPKDQHFLDPEFT